MATTFPGATSTYTGATRINGGKLQLGSRNALSAGSDIILANTAAASLDLNGFNQTIKSLTGGGTTGGNMILGGGATLTIGGPNTITNNNFVGTEIYGGQISGSGNLTFTGGANVLLTNNANTYTGQTNINGGSLVISNMGQLGQTSLVAVNGFTNATATTGVTGTPGGMLVVQGGSTGLVFDRNLTLASKGDNTTVGLSLLNIGNNIYTGQLSTGISGVAAVGETRIGSSFGNFTLASTGTLYNAGA